MKGTGPRSKKDDESPSIGLWLIGILIGAGLMALSLIVVDFVDIVFDISKDGMRWFYFFQMIIWIIGSFLISLSAIIPGFINGKLPPALRSGLIIAGVLGLIWSLNWASSIVP